jgi:hypothetical protein
LISRQALSSDQCLPNEIIKSAGYAGLVIVIDEAETILRMQGDVRGKSLNAIRLSTSDPRHDPTARRRHLSSLPFARNRALIERHEFSDITGCSDGSSSHSATSLRSRQICLLG